MPLVIANSLHCQLVILQEGNGQNLEIENVLPTHSVSDDRSIIIRKRNDHYNGVVLSDSDLPVSHPVSA